MSIAINTNIHVTIHEMQHGSIIPQPLPTEHGFTEGKEYLVLAVYNASETSECLLMMANDRNELWHIPSRHVRFAHV